MSEHKFKVGDKVRDVSADVRGEGRVVHVDEEPWRDGMPYRVAFRGTGDYGEWMGIAELVRAAPRAYLAGPMRGLPEYNFPAFLAAEAQLKEAGIEVFNPAQHDIDNGFDYHGLTGHEDLSEHGFDLRKALGADVNFIAHESAGVILLPGWEKSSGARAEVALAKALSLPVVTLEGALHEGGLDAPQVDFEVSLTTRPVAVLGFDGSRSSNTVLQASINETHRRLGDIDVSFGTTSLTSPSVALTGEVRSVSSAGGEKGVKPERLDLLPTQALSAVARHYGVGAAKYAPWNWRKGYEWSKSYAALQRHANAFWGGEDIDEETGSPHMAAVAFHALALLTFMEEQPGFDDRYKKESSAA